MAVCLIHIQYFLVHSFVIFDKADSHHHNPDREQLPHASATTHLFLSQWFSLAKNINSHKLDHPINWIITKLRLSIHQAQIIWIISSFGRLWIKVLRRFKRGGGEWVSSLKGLHHTPTHPTITRGRQNVLLFPSNRWKKWNHIKITCWNFRTDVHTVRYGKANFSKQTARVRWIVFTGLKVPRRCPPFDLRRPCSPVKGALRMEEVRLIAIYQPQSVWTVWKSSTREAEINHGF